MVDVVGWSRLVILVIQWIFLVPILVTWIHSLQNDAINIIVWVSAIIAAPLIVLFELWFKVYF
jgi:hypothetical protein